MSYVILGARTALAVVFLVSALTKVRTASGFRAFRRSIRDMQLLPASALTAAAAATAGVELAVVALLAIPVTVIAGFVLATATVAVLTTVTALTIRRGIRSPCRCFGRSTTPLGAVHVTRNMLLLAVATFGGIASLLVSSAPPQTGGVAVAVPAGLLVAVLVVVFEDVVALFSEPTSARPAQHVVRGGL